MSKRPPLDFPLILDTANGQWVNTVFPYVGIQFNGNPNHHQSCPLCGGHDRFRCDNKNGDGTWICNQCGAGNGYTLVKEYIGANDAYEVYKTIAQALGIEGTAPTTEAERQAWRQQQIERERQQSERDAQTKAEKREARLNASRKAQEIWQNSVSASSHSYLDKKQISPISIRQQSNHLIIPMYYHNWQTGETTLVNVQKIDSEGNKLFVKGGLVKGCYTPLGSVAGGIILLCEGYATGVSIWEALDGDYQVVVAYNAGNLLPVAQSIRHQYPHHRILICADDDRATAERLRQTDIEKGKNPKPLEEYNDGIHKAKKACEAVGGEMVYPVFNLENKEVA